MEGLVSDANVCVKCGSAKVAPRVKVRDVGDYNAPGELAVMLHENPDALFFKETFITSLTARVCGECGYAELYAEQPGELYAAYERSKQPRD
jgi:predicted nucleic-acid-binding Zn-ribbon protein